MKPLQLLVSIALWLGAAASGQAELVRLSFSHFDGFFLWRTNDATVRWDHSLGDIYRLNLYYDTETATRVSPDSPTYRLADSVNNYWSIYIAGPGPDANFKLSAPLQTIDYSLNDDGSQSLRFSSPPPENGDLELTATFRGPVSGDSLPVPPLHFESADIKVWGGAEWFPYPNMGEGYGYGSFEEARAEVVPEGGFTPVPEPTTYGIAGAGMLLMIALRCRWRGRGCVSI